MSSSHERAKRITDTGIVAIIRAPSSEQLLGVARALYEGGIDVIEITLTVPRALEIISAVRDDLGDKVLLGAGTVLDAETARAAMLAGAEFIVSPTVNVGVIEMCRRCGTPVMPGAFTPTEILAAWEAGADIVKVFPADVGGPSYLKAIHGPLPHIPLLPTGGVNLDTLADYLKAGACAVGLGSSLLEKQAVANGDFDRIHDLAGKYVQCLREARTAG